MPFRFETLQIPGVILVRPAVFRDERGAFMETYKRSEFAAAGINEVFVQESHSSSRRGVLRGLHYQRAPHAQGKLVRVVSGSIFDVAVDLRPGQPTTGSAATITLSSADPVLLYIPAWCAHGFCVLSDAAEVSYLMSAEYAPQHEAGVMWNDPALRIEWPIDNPVLSPRDRTWPRWTPDGSRS